jgi:hypothetical protein
MRARYVAAIRTVGYVHQYLYPEQHKELQNYVDKLHAVWQVLSMCWHHPLGTPFYVGYYLCGVYLIIPLIALLFLYRWRGLKPLGAPYIKHVLPQMLLLSHTRNVFKFLFSEAGTNATETPLFTQAEFVGEFAVFCAMVIVMDMGDISASHFALWASFQGVVFGVQLSAFVQGWERRTPWESFFGFMGLVFVVVLAVQKMLSSQQPFTRKVVVLLALCPKVHERLPSNHLGCAVWFFSVCTQYFTYTMYENLIAQDSPGESWMMRMHLCASFVTTVLVVPEAIFQFLKDEVGS